MQIDIRKTLTQVFNVYKESYPRFFSIIGFSLVIYTFAIVAFAIGFIMLFGTKIGELQLGGLYIAAMDDPSGLIRAMMILLPFITFFVLFFQLLKVWFSGSYVIISANTLDESTEKIGFTETLSRSGKLILKLFAVNMVRGFLAAGPIVAIMLAYTVLTYMIRGQMDPSFMTLFRLIRVVLGLLSIPALVYLFYASLKYTFSHTALILDHTGVLESVRKSAELIRGRWANTFFTFFFISIILWVVNSALSVKMNSEPLKYLMVMIRFTVTIVTIPFWDILITIMYRDYKQEGLPNTPQVNK